MSVEKRPLILLTGFNAFAGLCANPSELIVREIELGGPDRGEYDLVCEVLPTEFAASGVRIGSLIAEHEPDACVCLGVNTAASAITLERFALNVNDARCPDNAGEQPCGRAIVEGGPAAYRSTLPLEDMAQALSARGIPAAYSNHAGAFVCNHVSYLAAHACERRARPASCGFIHVPWPRELGPTAHPQPSAPTLATLVQGVRTCLAVLARRP